ncbi:hypothetical protein Rhopal_006815-T1 [Rhodotorula paludigena]|uniref:Uncharacterized protein n=1 Tax=Rhodotorula paludigena TaxID=86838 RepID=A0AAV5GZ32_9BASI|nr:hypothetical protein Rhopal_006815-T1 [Rhodotorula paludigena]
MVTRIPRLSLYRRRPPRTPLPLFITWALVAVVSLVLSATEVAAQATTSISDPSTTTFELDASGSAFFHLSATSSSPVWISLSLCSVPSTLSADSSYVLPTRLNHALFVSTTADEQAPGPRDGDDSGAYLSNDGVGGSSRLEFGYAAFALEAAPSDGVWIGVYTPGTDDLKGDNGGSDGTLNATGSWSFELSLSSGTSAAPYAPAHSVGLRLDDTDASSALLVTANWSAAASTGTTPPAGYDILVAPTQPHALALGRSRCALRDAHARAAGSANASTTTRGYGGGERTQFLVEGLQRASNYTAWLVQNETVADGGANQTRVWDPVFFATKSGDSCRLVYGIEACPAVAYSVPSPRSLDTADLVSYFNESISASLTNFTRTLTTFPCDSVEMGQYSVVSTCSDCSAAYRDWLCATTIPRCTDAPGDTRLNLSVLAGPDDLAAWSIPSDFDTTLVRNDPLASRTPLFGAANLSSTFPSLFNASFPASGANALDESPFPYSEVPPCLDVCNLVEARCPPFLEWVCPRGTAGDLKGGTASAAYGLTREVPEGHRQAGDVQGSELDMRAADRFGNVL